MSYGKYALALLTTSSILILSACGGGGGSDSTSNQQKVPSTPAPKPKSISTPLPTGASAPSDASAAVEVGEALPSLSNPQPGSTALTGNNAEGIWTSSTSIANYSMALVDPIGNVSNLDVFGSIVMSQLYGVISSTADTWTMTSGWSFGQFLSARPIASGSGTYALHSAFNGSYVVGEKSTDISWTYDPANALSVTQESVAGTWSYSTTSLDIASDGSFTGKFENCNVSGTLLLATPGSNHNMYAMTVSAAPGTSCPMPAGMTYTGSAAIKFLPISGSNGYRRTLLYNVTNMDDYQMAYGQLSKQ